MRTKITQQIKRTLPLIFAAATLFLAGCLEGSKNPLSTPSNSQIDLQLEGDYQTGDSKDTGFWHIRYQRVQRGEQHVVTPWVELLSVGHGKGGMQVYRQKALATKIAGHNYLSMSSVDEFSAQPKKGALYAFYRYDFDWRGRLYLYGIDEKLLAAAVKAGKLHSSAKKESDILLTDSTERLVAFIAANDPKKLFPEKTMSMSRLSR